MPFGDESESEEEEVRADDDPEITAGGRKVVHSTAVNADSKAYAYLPPGELGLDLDEILKVLEPALMAHLRQQDPNYFRENPLQVSSDYEARVGVGDNQVRTAVVVAHDKPEVMAALAAIAAGFGALHVLGIPLVFQNIVAFRATAATLEGRTTRVRHSRRKAYMMDFKATGITSTVEADSFLNELCRVSGGEVPAFFLMERREQRGSMLLDGALRIWFCPVEGQQFVWPDEVVVRLQENGVARPVTLNRFTNVVVHEDEYKICCGAVGACATGCSKRDEKPKRTGQRGGLFAPKRLPPAVQEAKRNYARAILAACAPHIVQGKIGGLACRRSLCQEFNDNKRGKGERRGHSKLMLPGMACGMKGNAYPCVAKLARAEFPACQAAPGHPNP